MNNKFNIFLSRNSAMRTWLFFKGGAYVTCPDIIYVMILIIDLCRLKCLLEVSESVGLEFKPTLLSSFSFFPYFLTSSFFSTLYIGACALSAVVVVFSFWT